MKARIKKAGIVLILVGLTQLLGCTSMRTVESESDSVVDQLEIGDHLIIHEKSDRFVDMTLASIDGDVLRGGLTSDPLRSVEVNMSDVEKIEREDIDGVKTTLAVVGGGTAIYYILLVLFWFAVLG